MYRIAPPKKDILGKSRVPPVKSVFPRGMRRLILNKFPSGQPDPGKLLAKAESASGFNDQNDPMNQPDVEVKSPKVKFYGGKK